jgi:hypothetical protein
MSDLTATNALLAEKARLLKKINRLERKETKRKRAKKEKKGKHGAPKTKHTKKRPKVSSLATKASDPTGKDVRGKVLRVKNPRTGAQITINPEPGKRNRAWRKIVEAARAVGWRNGNIHTESLVQILAQLFKDPDGPRHFDYDFIPEKVQRWAREHASCNGSAADAHPEDAARPREVENFEDAFITVKLDMTGPDYGKGFHEDLSAAQELVASVLRKRRECWKNAHFKVYFDYDFIMAKDGDGSESLFRISSTGHGNGTADVVRKNSDCDNVVSRGFEKLTHALIQLAVRGSGWSFRRSVLLLIRMNRIVTGIPLTGDNDEKVREQIERRDEDPDIEDMAVDDDDDADVPGPSAPMGVEAIASYVSLAQKGGSYCPLPSWTTKLPKGTTFNPRATTQEDNQKCFLWALLAAEHPFGVAGYERFNTKYVKRGISKCNINHIKDALEHGAISLPKLPPSTSFPVSLDDRFFEAVELLNDERFSFSVYEVGFRDKEIYPFYASKHKRKGKPHLRLLLVANGKASPGPLRKPGKPGRKDTMSFEAPVETFHFATLFDPIPVLGMVRTSKQRLQDYISKYGLKEGDVGTFWCDNCFCRFAKVRWLWCIFSTPSYTILFNRLGGIGFTRGKVPVS